MSEIVELYGDEGCLLAAGPADAIRAYAPGTATHFVIRGCRWRLTDPVRVGVDSVARIRMSFFDTRTGEPLEWPAVADRITRRLNGRYP